MIKTILFDLDGTLLPITESAFIDIYFPEMAKHFARAGYDASLMLKALLSGTEAMRKNDGTLTNDFVFWQRFNEILPGDRNHLQSLFESFYAGPFDLVKNATFVQPYARLLIKQLKALGYQLVLATNPLFPAVSTLKRAQWADLDKEDFSLITTLEDATACKPNPLYFKNVLNRLHILNPSECLMIGNDAREDLAAQSIGIQTFLVTDYLINKDNVDLTNVAKGNFIDLKNYLNQLLQINLVL
jgi:FMN phosphatase YigB (HAD superfamily)